MFKWFCVGLVVVGLAVFWPSLHQPVQGDMAVYTYIADGMNHGHVPYRDSWDIKSPGIYFQFAAALAAFRGSETGILFFEWLIAMGACVAAFVAARKLAGELAGLFAGVALFAAYTRFALTGWGYQPETPALLLSLILLIIALDDGELSLRESLLAGLATALLLWYKLPFALFGLVLLPRLFARDGRARTLLSIWPAVAGFVGIGLFVVAYFWANEAFDDFVQGSFSLARKLVQTYALPLGKRLVGMFEGGAHYWGWAPVLVVCSAIGAFFHAGPKGRVVLFLVLAVLIVFWQGRYLSYHWLAALGPLAVLAGVGASLVSGWAAKFVRPAWVRGVLLGAGLCASSVTAVDALWGGYVRGGWSRAGMWRNIRSNYGRGADAVEGNIAPELGRRLGAAMPELGTILAFDLDPIVNFYAQRRSPTRFIYLWPLEDKRFAGPGWNDEFVRDIEAARPLYIVVSRYNLRDGSDGLKKLLGWPGLGLWFKANYVLLEKHKALEVYRIARRSS